MTSNGFFVFKNTKALVPHLWGLAGIYWRIGFPPNFVPHICSSTQRQWSIGTEPKRSLKWITSGRTLRNLSCWGSGWLLGFIVIVIEVQEMTHLFKSHASHCHSYWLKRISAPIRTYVRVAIDGLKAKIPRNFWTSCLSVTSRQSFATENYCVYVQLYIFFHKIVKIEFIKFAISTSVMIEKSRKLLLCAIVKKQVKAQNQYWTK